MFEYDTEEEYQLYLSQALQAHKDLQKLKLEQYQTVKNSLEVIENKPIKQELRLQELWQKFVIHEKRAGKELKQIEEYEPTFKKLREFYGDKKNIFFQFCKFLGFILFALAISLRVLSSFKTSSTNLVLYPQGAPRTLHYKLFFFYSYLYPLFYCLILSFL